MAAAIRSWDEDLLAEAERSLTAEQAAQIAELASVGIPENYKADVAPAAAVADLSQVARLRADGQPFALSVTLSEGQTRLRVYRTAEPITLSAVLPQLQHMGLEVVDEHPYQFDGAFWIYNFGLQLTGDPPTATDAATAATEVEATITALWNGQTEDDGFNALVLDAGLTWHQVVLLRAYARYLRQAGLPVSQEYLQQVLRAQPRITPLLGRLFDARVDPAKHPGAEEVCAGLREELRGLLEPVTSLDHDRILRAHLPLIDAALRHGHYPR